MHDSSAEQALSTFLRDREKLIATACSIVESRAVAEELVQDSWLRWHERQYPSQKSQQILRRIVRNLSLDWLRRDKTERQILKSQFLLTEDAPDSERILSARQELRRVVAVLNELPDRTYRAFRMHRLDGLSYAAIAKKMNVAPSTAFKLVEDAMVHVVVRLRD